jgi:glucokinase
VQELALAARAGEASAQGAFSGYSADLAEFLEPCVRAFAPTCVVVGGSISRAWDLIGPTVVAAFPCDVVQAARLDEAALLGAARHTLSTSELL